MPELLTVKEVADLLRVTPMTIYRAVDQGTIPFVRFGRTIRFDRDALESYLQTPKDKPRNRPNENPRNRAPVTRL